MKQQSLTLIEKLKLRKYDIQDLAARFTRGEVMPRYFVSTFDLESALEKATVVYGNGKDSWGDIREGIDTHIGLVVCVEKLTREHLKHEYKTKIESCDGWLQMPQSFKGKNVKITIEEIKE